MYHRIKVNDIIEGENLNIKILEITDENKYFILTKVLDNLTNNIEHYAFGYGINDNKSINEHSIGIAHVNVVNRFGFTYSIHAFTSESYKSAVNEYLLKRKYESLSDKFNGYNKVDYSSIDKREVTNEIPFKEIFKFVITELLWCLDESKDIYTQGMRESLSDELIKELIDEVNKKYKINLIYTTEIDKMDIFQFCDHIKMNIK